MANHCFIARAIRGCVLAMIIAAIGTPVLAASATNPAVNTIRIGGNLELSGRYAYYGEIVAQGAKIAFKEVNDAGGVLGRKIEFVPLDNASDRAKAAVVMKSLAARGNVTAVLGCLEGRNTEAAAIVAEQSRIPLLAPAPYTNILSVTSGKPNANAFATCVSESFQVSVLARFAAEELGARTAAIVFNGAITTSGSLAAVFEQTFTKAGGKIVAKEQTGSGEFSQEFLTPIRNAEPEVIFIPVDYREAGLVIRCLREGGVHAPLLGTDLWDYQQIVAYAGEEALNDAYHTVHFASGTKLPKVSRFIEAFTREYKETPDIFAAIGYEAALVLVEAIKKAGSSDPESVRAALEGIEVEGLLGPIRIEAADHNVVKPVAVMRLIEGQPVAYRLFKP